GHGRAALRDADEDAVGADDVDADALARDRAPLLGRLERDGLLLRYLVGLQALEHLLHDRVGGQLPGAEREVEVLGLLEAALADHLGEHGRAGELPVRELLRLQRLLEPFAALLLGLLARLAREPLANLVAGPRRRGEREPVARRASTRLRGQDLDGGGAPDAVGERDAGAVHRWAGGAVPER